MAKINGGISTIYEAWHDVASGTTRPTFPSEYSTYTDDRCIINDSTLLSICNVRIKDNPSVVYSEQHNQCVKYIDLIKRGGGPIPVSEYFRFIVLENNTEIGISHYCEGKMVRNQPNIEYSLDNGQTWVTWTGTTEDKYTTITGLNTGDVILMRGVNEDGFNKYHYDSTTPEMNGARFSKFNTNENISVAGNIMTIINYNNIYKDISYYSGCFMRLFETLYVLDSIDLVLPSSISDYCYYSMFWNCASLVTAPALPATTLASYCYWGMFGGCTSLLTAPALPATTLASGCYSAMFWNCTSLVTAPALSATTLANYCYYQMFSDCTSLLTAPALPATTLASGCYASMFQNCTSLTTAPALPTTSLVDWCYSDMFYNCTSLVTAPALPATTLANYCYYQMFWNCTKLNYIKCLATDISADNCTNYWVTGVGTQASGTKEFVAPASMQSVWESEGTSGDGIPNGFTYVGI